MASRFVLPRLPFLPFPSTPIALHCIAYHIHTPTQPTPPMRAYTQTHIANILPLPPLTDLLRSPHPRPLRPPRRLPSLRRRPLRHQLRSLPRHLAARALLRRHRRRLHRRAGWSHRRGAGCVNGAFYVCGGCGAPSLSLPLSLQSIHPPSSISHTHTNTQNAPAIQLPPTAATKTDPLTLPKPNRPWPPN